MLTTTLEGIEFASAYPDLLGKRVLITGIDNDHGVDIARAFAEQRTRLVLHVNEMTPEMEVLGEVVAHGALDVRLYDGPIGATDAAVKLARQAVQAFGGVDIVINLASVPAPKGGAAARESDVEDAVSQTLGAACLITKIATNRMRLTMTEGLVLTIVQLPRNPTSAHRVVGALARSALANLTRNEAREWAPHGIQINAIAPATVSTMAPYGGLNGEPDMASLALHLASEEGHDLTGLLFECHGA
jgi:NAD(P)-dependent dehydrogenase (short-subunit alcohol dehydrogenase family)